MMSDEKTDEHDNCDLLWEHVPREARLVVYEYMRTMIASHRKDSAMATLLRDVTAKGTGVAVGANPIEVLHEVAAMAFVSAIATLEASDADLCLECGSYHDDDEFVHVPSTDPKDLS
jgi:hypothetical protein